jgi:opacity protein-like surface antigen
MRPIILVSVTAITAITAAAAAAATTATASIAAVASAKNGPFDEATQRYSFTLPLLLLAVASSLHFLPPL